MATAWPPGGLPWSSSSVPDESLSRAPLSCEVPGCGRRFATQRLLGLHLRMGHGAFDTRRVGEASKDPRGGGACAVDLGGGVR